jgi:hypothetical protein
MAGPLWTAGGFPAQPVRHDRPRVVCWHNRHGRCRSRGHPLLPLVPDGPGPASSRQVGVGLGRRRPAVDQPPVNLGLRPHSAARERWPSCPVTTELGKRLAARRERFPCWWTGARRLRGLRVCCQRPGGLSGALVRLPGRPSDASAEVLAGGDAELGEYVSRCHSTVRALMNSCVLISWLVRPSRASLAIRVSWAVSSAKASTLGLRTVRRWPAAPGGRVPRILRYHRGQHLGWLTTSPEVLPAPLLGEFEPRSGSLLAPGGTVRRHQRR